MQDIGVANPNFENDEKIRNDQETHAEPIISTKSVSLASVIDETTKTLSESSKIIPDEEQVKPEIQSEKVASGGLEDLLSGSGNGLLAPVTSDKSEPEKPETKPPGSSVDLLGTSLL